MILVRHGHGHVYPRVDGVKARCGGPKICKECALDKARLDRTVPLTKEDVKNGIADLRTAPGGFASQLSWKDRLRLRAITKRVHMRNFPRSMITDYEADKIIDVMAPETWTFLIHRHGSS